VLRLRSDFPGVLQQNDFHTRVSFRIYRETLSRFSCAASERYGQIFMWRSGIGGSAPASRARPGCEKIWNLPGLLAYWA
ncbi:hypothetical protein ABLN64_02565, partial [Mycobacterium tuberculosis]